MSKIYVKLGNIKGNCTDAAFKDQLVFDSLNFSASRDYKMDTTGTASNRGGGKASFSEITLTKAADSSAGELFNQVCTGFTAQKCTITFVRTDAGKSTPFMTYDLEDCVVSSYSISANAGDDAPHEVISLNFVKILVSFTDTTSKNAAGQKKVFGFNIAENKKV